MNDNGKSLARNKSVSKLLIALLAVAICIGFMPLISGQAMAASKKPAKVKGLTVSVSADNNVSIKWKKAKKAKKYEVNIKDSTSTLVATKKVKSKKYSFKGQVKTTYTIKVRALNGKKKGKWSSKKTATTNASAEEAAAKKSADEASKKAKDAEAAAAAAEQKQKETADELAKTAAAALQDHKDAAAEVLDLIVDPSDYDAGTWATVQAIIDKANADIEAAANADDVDAILLAAEEELAKIETVLDKTKTDAVNELEGLRPPKASSKKSAQDTIDGIVDDAEVAILFADEVAEVQQILTTAKAKVDAVKTLDTLVNLEDYDEVNAEVVKGLIEDAQGNIRNAANIGDVKQILKTTEAAIEMIPTSLDAVKEAALEELGGYYDHQAYYEKGDWADIKDILEEAEGEIGLAETPGAVQEIVDNVEGEIGKIPTILGKAQTAATEELEAYYELEEAYDQNDWTDIKGIIDDAVAAVREAKSADAVEAIVAIAEGAIDEYPTILESAQAEAKAELAAYYEDQYTEEDWEDIEALIRLGTVSIMQADSAPEVGEILEKTKGLIAMYPTILESAQAEAILELTAYAAMNEYDEDTQVLVDAAVENGIEEINAATTEKEVQGALLAAEAEIDIYPTVLDGYKEEQLNLLRTHYDRYAGMEWMSETESISMKQIQDRINEAAEEMIFAFDEDDVDEIIADAKKDINVMFRGAAMAELTEYAKYKGFYSAENWETVESIVGLATVTITEADSEDADVVITATVIQTEALIATVPTSLDEAKADAIDALYAYANPKDYDEDGWAAVGEIIASGEEEINSVVDFVDLDASRAAVNDTLDTAEAAIDLVPTELDKYKLEKTRGLYTEYVYNEEYKDLSWETMQKIQTVIRNAAVAMGDEDVNTEAKVDVIVSDAEKQIADILKAPIAKMLEAYRLNKDLYTEQYWPAVDSIIDLGVIAINAAKNEEDMWKAFNKAKALIEVVPTKLDLHKSSAINDLYDFVDESDYDDDEREEIFGEEGIIAEATADIAAVEVDLEKYETVAEAEEAAEDEVDGICAAAELLISAVDTKLDKYKAEQIEELREDCKVNPEYNDLDWATMKEILAIIDETEEALDDEEVADKDAVVEIIDEAKEKIAALLPNLEAYRQDALDELDELFGELDSEDYGDAWDDVVAAYNIGVGAIKFAGNEKAVDKALGDAESVIMAIPTVLDARKIVAVAELDAYAGTFDKNDYEENDWNDFLGAVDDGKKAINDAKGEDGVDDALDDAKDALDAIPTSMDRLRESKVKELNDYVASVKGIYDEDGLEEIAGIVGDAAEAIDNTEDEDIMNEIVAGAIEDIGAVKTALEKAKEAAKEDLDEFAEQYYEEYPDLSDDFDEAVADGEDDIDAARTVKAVNEALEEAKEAIDDIIDEYNDDWAAEIDTAIESLKKYGAYQDGIFKITEGQEDALAEDFADVSSDYDDYLAVFGDDNKVNSVALYNAVKDALSQEEPVPEP